MDRHSRYALRSRHLLIKLSTRVPPFSLLTVLAFAPVIANCQTSAANIVISQIYGGGGNKGATLRNDFIELFNRGTAAVTISGWSIQHASATGTSWDRTLLNGTIQPGHYYLIQEAQGNGGTVSLPAPDATGGIDISATADKIALVSNSINLTGSSPTGSTIVDFVGYGSANAAEGQPASALDNLTALIRQSNGCTDTSNNLNDFTTGTPNPRNSGSSANLCSASQAPPPSSTQPVVAAIVNAATFSAGPIAPGEIVTIFGTNLGPSYLTTLQLSADGRQVATSLVGTEVLFDGVPAPIIYTSSRQVSAVVPFGVGGRTSTNAQVSYNRQASNTTTLEVAPTVPAIFTADSSGRGEAAVLNQDYSVNSASNPALAGSFVIVYATGAGQTIPAGQDGSVVEGNVLPQPLQSVNAWIGGVSADVLYGGAAPGLVSGVLQVNVRVPTGVSGSVPLLISVGDAQSQSGVTLWVSAPRF